MEIGRIANVIRPELDAIRPARPGSGNVSFGGVLQDAITEVDRMQGEADQKVRNMLSGDGEDLHSAMLAVEKASLSFELMMQVRNKVVSAYQEIARLQF